MDPKDIVEIAKILHDTINRLQHEPYISIDYREPLEQIKSVIDQLDPSASECPHD